MASRKRMSATGCGCCTTCKASSRHCSWTARIRSASRSRHDHGDGAMTLHALIVDDEPLARSRLRSLIASCDAPAVLASGEAGNAAQAMELLGRRSFDVVLLDIHMPGADGLAL